MLTPVGIAVCKFPTCDTYSIEPDESGESPSCIESGPWQTFEGVDDDQVRRRPRTVAHVSLDRAEAGCDLLKPRYSHQTGKLSGNNIDGRTSHETADSRG